MLLSEEFLAPYKDKQPPFGTIGLVVFYRTYSRYLANEGRRERWWEVVKRVVEYSVSLVDPIFLLEDEAEDLYDAIFNMRLFPAGRTLWVGGTDVVKRDGIANFNCAFKAINSIESFSESLYLLMNGCGVGFSVEPQHVDHLPTFRTDLLVSHKDYSYIAGVDDTVVKEAGDIATIYVGDSKEGWRDALYALLEYHLDGSPVSKVEVEYRFIRPVGTPLKTFGGRASGHEPLQHAFKRIHEIISKSGGKLSSVEAMDIETVIASVVVVGGVRRSSLIALGGANDSYFIEAKQNLFTDPSKAQYRSTRVMSNNSVMLYKNPGSNYFKEMLEVAFSNGEPGLINAESALQRRDDFEGLNPCAEILLRDRGLCNLSEVNLAAHVRNGRIDKGTLFKSLRLATRHCSRITEVDILHEGWDKTQKEDRLLGVSLTGIMSAKDKTNMGAKRLPKLFDFCHWVVRMSADSYHDQRGIPRAKLATCIKPSGTLSQLPGVSSGIHRDYAPYYIRRVRISKHDPVAKSLTLLGFKSMPENGQGKDFFDNLHATINYKLDMGEDVEHERAEILRGMKALESIGIKDIPQDPSDSTYLRWSICTTKVFSFPIKTNAKIRASKERAIAQLERYKASMKYYTEHNTSVTITFKREEISDIADWLTKNWRYYVGVSFLPVFPDYPQLPYQACTLDEYQAMPSAHISEDDLASYIAAFETGEEWDVDSDCASGGCPVR